MRIKNIKPIEPELSKCISVDSPNKLFAIGESKLLTHNSVVQQNIILSCILRPEKWKLFGIDLKRVEITRFRKYGVPVASELWVATEILKFTQAVMMRRYEDLEKVGRSNYMETFGEENGEQAILVMIDEAAELLSPASGKSLASSTKVKTVQKGQIPIQDIQIGDLVYDSNNDIQAVEEKYKPTNMDTYKMSIKQESTNTLEDFIVGEDHLWTTYIVFEDGFVDKRVVDTKTLFELKNRKDIKKIKFSKK